MESRLNIRAVGARYGVSARTLRFYEEAGILQSHRIPDSGYREYDENQIKRLEIVLLLRGLSFSVREIAGLLNGDSRLTDAFRMKLTQSDQQLLELRETNRMLHKLEAELFREPRGDISAADILGELIFLTKQTERMLRMNQSETDKYMVLFGVDIAMPVVGENGGDLVRKIKTLREAIPNLPIIRLRDEESLKPDEAVIIWNGAETWRGTCSADPTQAALAIIEQLKTLV
jgi:DNA-binding transcriptional MerR regulator